MDTTNLGAIRARALRTLGAVGLSREDAEDAAQDALLARAGRTDAPVALVNTVARYEARTIQRRRFRAERLAEVLAREPMARALADLDVARAAERAIEALRGELTTVDQLVLDDLLCGGGGRSCWPASPARRGARRRSWRSGCDARACGRASRSS